MAGADYKNIINNDLVINFKAGYYRTHWEDQTTSANISTVNLYRGEAQTTLSLNSSAVLVSGIEASYSDVNSNLFGKPGAAVFGIYSQADIRLPFPLLVTAGLRFDYNKLDSLEAFSDFSPKLGLNYSLSENIILRGSVGAGFRAPSLAEAFTSTVSSGITVKPNPELKPESSISVEAGVKWMVSDNLSLDAALFQNEYYDYIEPGVDYDGKIIFKNVVRARIQGYELTTLINLFHGLDINLDYTYLRARDIEKERALKYRPRHIFSSGINYKFLSFDIGADFRYWSKIEEIDDELITLGLVPDGEVRDEVLVLDLTAGYGFSLANVPVRLSLTANNVLNYYYVELIGNVAPIRNVSLSAEFVF
jgi:outer membrane receptor for ferrienterochelin and colicins